MTPQELYEWAKERRLEDAPIRVDCCGDDEYMAFPEIKDVCNGCYTVVVCANDE